MRYHRARRNPTVLTGDQGSVEILQQHLIKCHASACRKSARPPPAHKGVVQDRIPSTQMIWGLARELQNIGHLAKGIHKWVKREL